MSRRGPSVADASVSAAWFRSKKGERMKIHNWDFVLTMVMAGAVVIVVVCALCVGR